MDWLTKQYRDVLVVSLEGALDAVSVPQAEAFLDKKVQEGKHKIVLNFQYVTYMSSAGIRLLFSLSKSLQACQGLLCVCCVSDAVAEVIRIAGVDQLLPVCQSEQECFTKF
ncbi:anti-sigma F factor antagonist [Chlamydia felis Fe/C-56]|uniref:Anti-sigma factor antagonist n=1 Tax=Chlamydia felis (strain Fe/C-56) TaxID=264202 RepID=Q255V9_CHLFF|nr:STAS domain-containing protein [Chlamydia felis]BAE80929.1 anti-sigma F factor antagonist [Chlamydia felis Fe/C-56]